MNTVTDVPLVNNVAVNCVIGFALQTSRLHVFGFSSVGDNRCGRRADESCSPVARGPCALQSNDSVSPKKVQCFAQTSQMSLSVMFTNSFYPGCYHVMLLGFVNDAQDEETFNTFYLGLEACPQSGRE